MSSGNFNVKKADLQEVSDKLQGEKEKVEEIIKTMDSLIKDDMPNYWEGAAAEAFGDQFDGLKSTAFADVCELIDEISKQITKVISIVDEADKEMARAFQG